MIRKTIAGLTAAAAIATPIALASPAQATENGTTILKVVDSVDRYTSTEVEPIAGSGLPGVDRFRWDQRNWYDFDILTAAVVANGTLAGAVKTPSTAVTLFAPNDRAFQLLAYDLTGKWSFTEAGVLAAIVSKVGTGDALTKVLTYHVVSGKVLKADVRINEDIQTLNAGQTVKAVPNKFGVQIQDAAPLRDPYLVNTDIDAGHSVIHSISRVLVPGNL
jgi:uncharacterized surface protein with fasciclin (FAS1) repeats